MSGLSLVVGEYTFSYPCNVVINKESIVHPSTDAVIGYRERWNVTSWVAGATVAALKTALDLVAAGLAGGADATLSDGETTAHSMTTANAAGGVKLVRPLSYPTGGTGAQWASNVRFEFALEGEFYAGDPDTLYEVTSYSYQVRENEREIIFSGEIVAKTGVDAYALAELKNPGTYADWQGPFRRIQHNAAWGYSTTKPNRATFEYRYLRGPSDSYEEYSQSWELETALTDFIHVPVLGGGDPVKQTTVKLPARARQTGRKSSLSAYPQPETPTWPDDIKAPKVVRKLEPERVTTDGQWKYTIEWDYVFERAANFQVAGWPTSP